VLDDVQGANISGLDCSHAPDAAPPLHLVNAARIVVRGCQPEAPGGAFLRLDGSKCADIALIGNDFSQMAEIMELAEDVNVNALRSAGNIEPKP
jgi:hypothetical protein